MRAIRLNQKSHHTHAQRSPAAHDDAGVLAIGRQDTSTKHTGLAPRPLPNLNQLSSLQDYDQKSA